LAFQTMYAVSPMATVRRRSRESDKTGRIVRSAGSSA
jgi:hypothetical protein